MKSSDIVLFYDKHTGFTIGGNNAMILQSLTLYKINFDKLFLILYVFAVTTL